MRAEAIRGQDIPVSVICPTFNQEKYIEQALKGFAAQKTSFRFNVFVGDDCSTDQTASIVKDYSQRYPDIFVPIFRDNNIGGAHNWQDMITRSSSKYLAFCDGDDYWTDPHKLQKQFDFMETNPSLRACFHDVEVKIETADGKWFQARDFSNTPDGKILWPSGNRRFIKKDSYRIENYIPFGFVHTSSMFIRWNYSIDFPSWFYGHGVGDYPMWLLQIGSGRFGYIDEIMSVHRRVSTSTYHFKDRYDFWRNSKPGWIALDESLLRYFSNGEFPTSISNALMLKLKDDLAKMIKGSLEKDPPEKTWELLVRYQNLIRNLFHIPVLGKYSHIKFKYTLYALKTMAPLPPYKVNEMAKALRKRNKRSELTYLTMN